MKFTWHGHSCVSLITWDGTRILIDPFITNNPTSDLDPDTVDADIIILTHGHNDHVGDTVAIAKRCDATVVAIVELADYLQTQGLRTHGMNRGGQWTFDFGSIKFVPALHSSSYNGQYMGEACGVVISDGSARVYHAGDTAFFSDMKYVGSVDVCFLPIGDLYTMGIDDAVLASEFIDSQLFVPIHYNTFPALKQNPYEFINRLKKNNGMVPEVGESVEL